MSDLRRQIRVEQSFSAVERLRNEFSAWLGRRAQADAKGQYQTQLAALETLVCQALADIETDAGRLLEQALALGEHYAACRLLENRALWVRRVLWGYFGDKFDQRDGLAEVRQTLETADDVVWSCYEEARRQAAALDSRFAARRPIPLAYIEPYFSPTARPRDQPPAALLERRVGQEFLLQYLPQLPIPLVSLPPQCLAEPWWLIYLAHEAGHHIQHDLELVLPFSQQLMALAAGGPSPADAGLWASWGQEIFADLFAVHMVGAAAVWALAELELQPNGGMALRKESYPSPAARLSLSARAADALGLAGTAGLAGFDPAALLA
ncbi:MAG: hypothetical protein ACRDHL_00935, partial [Candidatus Promineifilaceae bacterium]